MDEKAHCKKWVTCRIAQQYLSQADLFGMVIEFECLPRYHVSSQSILWGGAGVGGGAGGENKRKIKKVKKI